MTRDQINIPEASLERPMTDPLTPKFPCVDLVQAPDVSVVLTNWKRPQFLWEAFKSCLSSNVRELVVTSSCADASVKSVHEKIRQAFPSVKIVSEEGDSGNNVAWLRGVLATKTSHVTILHDDDLLLPSFSKVKEFLTEDVGFFLWNARRHGMGFNDEYPPLKIPDGAHPSTMLYKNLLVETGFTISPTSGCFRRSDLIRTLTEAQDNFGSDFYLKPTMMVGNDLLIWLRAIQRHRHFRYFNSPMVSYGHHADSTTCDDVFKARGKLGPIYKATREYFLDNRVGRLIHIVARYDPNHAETKRRIGVAAHSWELAYKNLIWKPQHVRPPLREHGHLQRFRGCPYLKDVLSIVTPEDNDIIVFTNDDTIFHGTLSWRILDFMVGKPCATAFRVEFQRGNCPNIDEPLHTLAGLKMAPGRDLFAFRPDWLRQNWDNIPDYLLGSTDWDSTLATLMRTSQSIHTTASDWLIPHPDVEMERGVILHESHAAPWAVNRMAFPENVYNRACTREWIERNGVGWFVG